jgi:hypothetical protein
MKRRTYLRAFLALASITALGLVLVSSAVAAGAPLLKSTQSVGLPALSEMPLRNEINPNGAATTYWVEYGPASTGFNATTEPVSIGAGSSYVSVSPIIRGLNNETEYKFRLKASNGSGTTTAGTYQNQTAEWRHQKGITWPSPYTSSGSFKIEVPSFGETVNCADNSSGSIGYQGQAQYKLTPSNCSLVGWPICQVAVSGPIDLGANFVVANQAVSVQFGESNCAAAPSMNLSNIEPFKVTLPPRSIYAVSQPMEYTASTKYGTHSVILTDTSSWSLTGLGQGYTFGWFE